MSNSTNLLPASDNREVIESLLGEITQRAYIASRMLLAASVSHDAEALHEGARYLVEQIGAISDKCGSICSGHVVSIGDAMDWCFAPTTVATVRSLAPNAAAMPGA